MKTLKNLSTDANELRVAFQNQIIIPLIKINNGIRGYKGQIYLLYPKFDRRTKIFKGVSKATYLELYSYLQAQSQRRFKQITFKNELMIVKYFINRDLEICFSRVWHNGVTEYSGKHWKAQSLALRNCVDRYGFAFYNHDYNFNSRHHQAIESADPKLVKLYQRIVDHQMVNWNRNVH